MKQAGRSINGRGTQALSLQTSESRFRNLFEQSPISMQIFSSDGKTLEINRAYEELWGLGYAHVKEYNILEDRQLESAGLLPFIRKAFAGEASVLPAVAYNPAAAGYPGRARSVKGFIYPVKDERGKVLQVVLMHVDVTDLVTAERALRSSQRQMRAVLDNSPAAIYMKDLAGRYLLVNRRFEELMHDSAATIVGKTDYDVFPEEIARSFRANDRQALESGVLEREETLPQNDGPRTFLSLKFRLTEADGTPYAVCGISTDITELKRAGELVRETARRQKAILDSIPDMAWLKDGEGRYIAVNEAFARVAGRRPAAIEGRRAGDVWPAAFAGRSLEADRAALRTARPVTFEETIVDRQGNARRLETIITPLIDNGRVTGVSGISRDITERRRMEETIRYQAYHDLLTGLPNKMLFTDHLSLELSQSRRNGKKIAVLFLDVDRFKNVNDSLGHEAGDLLLRSVAARLRSSVRATDTVARIGGDKFTVLLPLLESPEDASRIAEKVLRGFDGPFVVRGHALHLGASIGISLYPDDGSSEEALLKNADIALNYAKEEGRNRFQFASPALSARTMERIRLESALRLALERGELVVYYQPQVNVRTMRLVGVEALVRWNHPELGLLPPSRFIPVAEEIGLTIPIDQWVFRTACAQLKKWQEAGYGLQFVTVNLSARQFQQPDLAERIRAIVRETGLAPEAIGVEITETLAMRDTELTARNLRQLSAMGIRFLIDDFGTGYSSLSYLKKLPISKLKIDKSFIDYIGRDTDYQAIIDAVIAMAHVLKLEVLAEGVETQEQVQFLKGRECDELQGYCFSRPLPAEKMEELLAAHP